MTAQYDLGDSVELTFRVYVAGTLTNATVACTLTDPDGATSTPVVTSVSTGVYRVTVAPTLAGLWLFRFTATGAATTAEDGQFLVLANRTATLYATVPELRAHLGDDQDQLDAGELERALDAASRQIDRDCDRRFWRDTSASARTFAPEDGAAAWVDDIATRTGLVVKTDDDLDGTYETTWTEGTHYRLAPDNADLETPARPFERILALGPARTMVWDRYGRRTLQVTARWGWPAVPVEVNLACLLIAAALYRRRDAPYGVIGGGLDGNVVRISRFQDPDVKRLLDPFVRRRHLTLDMDPQVQSLYHGGRR